MNKDNLWDSYTKSQLLEIEKISKEYKQFLDSSKTEREFIKNTITLIEKKGFKNLENIKKIKAGDKVYYNNRDKNLLISVIGKEDIEKGVNLIAAHVDSPRLDLKQSPVYEDSEFAMLNTHYYGGIKKYQWGATPLAIHGIVYLKDGSSVELSIGEKEDDPVFSIPDILPHLSYNVQDDRKAREVLKGEELKLIIGSKPVSDKKEVEKYKAFIMKELKKDYGIDEDDFFTAEIEIVPALKAKDVGLDRSMIGAYGQDDRICAWTSLKAIIEIDKPISRTAVCYLVDKEEVGSAGATGMQSTMIEYFLGELLFLDKKDKFNDQILRNCLWKSKALSADVTAGINPIFKSVHDKDNSARLAHGIAIAKYTGHRGKSGSNDADAEYLQELRTMFNKEGVKFQIGGFGKVDEGGGSTVAKFLSYYGMKTIDAGPALLSMHSLFEISSKVDVFETYKAYKTFYKY